MAIVNVSPELTAFDAVSAPVHRQLPAVVNVSPLLTAFDVHKQLSQIEMCEYVSDVDTDVHVSAFVDVNVPPEAARRP
jgi:hypothetical protein